MSEDQRIKEVDEIMVKMYSSWQYRWCKAKQCACMGCVNGSGNAKISEREWEEWVSRNPQAGKI